MMMVFVASAVFAVAGWAGALLGTLLCAGREPFADGPTPMRIHPWMFAVASAVVGIGVARQMDAGHVSIFALAAVACCACAAADLQYGVVPDLVTLVPLAILVLVAIARRDYGVLISAAFVGLPFAVVALSSKGRGMGWGDVKLATLGGALVGAPNAVFAFVIAGIAAFAIGRFFLGGRPIAFAPYLVSSLGIVLCFGKTALP